MKDNNKIINTNNILEYIKENEPLCLSDISKKFNINWATAKTLLLELVLHGKINMKKCGKTWIVWLKNSKEK
jgi:predicted transcriptional regulator